MACRCADGVAVCASWASLPFISKKFLRGLGLHGHSTSRHNKGASAATLVHANSLTSIGNGNLQQVLMFATGPCSSTVACHKQAGTPLKCSPAELYGLNVDLIE